MKQHADFPEANMTLGAGDNPNTIPLKAMQVSHPLNVDHKGEPIFSIVGKFEFEDDEKQIIRQIFYEAMKKYWDEVPGARPDQDEEKFLDVFISALPPMYLTIMHGWPPIILSVAHPEKYGYRKVYNVNPKSN